MPWATSTRSLARLVFPARHVGIVACGLGALVLPSLEGDRLVVAALCVLVLLPIDVSMHASTRRTGRFPSYMPFLNQFSAAAVVLFVPEVLAPAAAVLVADDALTSFMFGRRTGLAAGLLGTALLAAVSIGADIADPWAPLVGLGISAVSCAVILGALAEGERSLRARFNSLVSEVDVVVWEGLPPGGGYSYVSRGAVALFGYPHEAWMEPAFWAGHIHPDDAEATVAESKAAISEGRDHVLHYRMRHADGHWVHVRDVVNVELDQAGRVTSVRGVMVDITDRRRAEELLEEQATHDVLTGLPNRALLYDRIDQAMKESVRTGAPVGLLLLDLDKFKEVNDTLGHEVGDQLLVAFGDRLGHELRDCDTVARLGGDEFAVLLTTTVDEEGARAVAERVVAALQQPFDLDGLDIHTSASIGIALYPDHASDAVDLVGRADVAMYHAKRSSRTVSVFDPGSDGGGRRRASMLAELGRALARDQLLLEYQPCFDLATGRLASVEALLRWDHPHHGRIGPDEFIRLAEMSGLMSPLTRHVLDRAVTAKRAAGLDARLAVNLSVRNLTETDLVTWLGELVSEHGLAHGELVLELTESAVMADVEAAIEVLEHIGGLGIELAVDDFGTGQSALAYLRRLPVHELKIDRAFVEGVGRDEGAAAICAAVIDLGHRLGLRIVAEGAGDAKDIAALRAMGCDMAQGYFLGNPVPESELAALAERTVDVASEP